MTNETDYPFSSPTPQCIHNIFETQAKNRPEAIAVVLPPVHLGDTSANISDNKLTYHALNQRANQLAHYLKKMGVGPDVLVGLCMERSLEMIVSILGILKAGGAYVPLDLAYPKDRLAFMLDDAQAPVLLTQSDLLERLPETGGSSDLPPHRNVICLDRMWAILSQESDENPETNTKVDDLAYVIYTSGSTGKPKGVLITHYNVTRLFSATDRWFQFNNRDVWTLFHSYAFDFSVWEIWGALLYGGRLVIVPYLISRSPETFYQLLRSEHVTVLNQTPSAFYQLIHLEEQRGKADDLRLRWVIFGGEALKLTNLRPWFDNHGDETPQLVNMYGITETTVHVTYRTLKVRDIEQASGSVIGGPISDLELHVLDEMLQPVPVNTPGELHVGGAGLARGYLNRLELTAERFIKNPFSYEPDARLYKSGDLVRRLPDGDIEYLGRIDHQVKIRGFRIELGEIEAALTQHPTVREAIVVAREDAPDDKRLVAYVIPKVEYNFGVDEVRASLSEQLPTYMIPTAFVKINVIPLTPNGKIDRAALPAPGLDRPELGTAYAAPQTELENLLADLWQEILGLQGVGIDDNFFELGGDSLKGAVLINKLQALLGEYIYIVALFDAPTISDLAAYLDKHYPQAVLKLSEAGDLADSTKAGRAASLHAARVDAAKVAQIQQLVTPLPPRDEDSVDTNTKNSQAIFILSPPRSGTTLLRVVLGGHPQLFAPPELDLLCFNTLTERKKALTGGDGFRLTGTIRALMDIKDCDADQAQQLMEEYEGQGVTTKQFYRRLQGWIAPRILVDKTTFYPLDMETLKRAELDFSDALYIHLTRHPYGMIRSFEEVRADRIYFKEAHHFSIRETGELTWLLCQQNILEFLQDIPPQRQHRLKFEDLVNQPETTVAGICQFLNLELHPNMLQPYSDQKKRMTDGIYSGAASRMLGDVKFHEHQGINPSIADRWQHHYTENFLGDITRQVMEILEYDPPPVPVALTQSAPIQTIPRTQDQRKDAEALLAQLDELSDEDIDALLQDALDNDS